MSGSIEGADVPAWQLWFDGCALPNPGRIGVGALLVSPDGARVELSRPTGRIGCSNEAELVALCAALEHADALGARHICIRGDSDFVVRHLRGESSALPSHRCSIWSCAPKRFSPALNRSASSGCRATATATPTACHARRWVCRTSRRWCRGGAG
jgi:ribonuclease HI